MINHRIKFEIDGMKAELVKCITKEALELQQAVEEEFKQLIESFDFRQYVRDYVRNNGRQILAKMVGEAVERSVTSWEVREAIGTLLGDVFREKLVEALTGDEEEDNG